MVSLPELNTVTVHGLAQLCQQRGADELLIHTVPANDGLVQIEALAHFPDGHTVSGRSRPLSGEHAREFPCRMERVQACTELWNQFEPQPTNAGVV